REPVRVPLAHEAFVRLADLRWRGGGAEPQRRVGARKVVPHANQSTTIITRARRPPAPARGGRGAAGTRPPRGGGPGGDRSGTAAGTDSRWPRRLRARR